MKNGRNAAITAAIACILYAPLALGPYAARAGDGAESPDEPGTSPAAPRPAGPGRHGEPQLPPGTTSFAGSFPRSFLIPGTETSLQIGGFVQIDAGYSLSGGNPQTSNGASQVTGAPSVSGSPLDLHGTGLFAPAPFNAHSRGGGVFHMSAGDSRL